MNHKPVYTVRNATDADLPAVMEIINLAKEDMKAAGSDQWQDGYPNKSQLLSDIRAKKSYVLTDEDGTVLGTAYISAEEEPSYRNIREGDWRFDCPYTVIHRIAVHRNARGRGLAGYLVRFAVSFSRQAGIRQLRIDTHPINIPMQHFLARFGFSRRGMIDLDSGVRIAYDYRIED